MIWFREKFYARRDEKIKWKDNSFESGKIIIEKSDRFNRQYQKILSIIDSKLIKGLISDIKKGFIYDDGPNGGDTHYLSDYSKPDKFLTYSKSINREDRLNYMIYKPNEDKSIKIVLANCKGHGLLDGRNYSEMED